MNLRRIPKPAVVALAACLMLSVPVGAVENVDVRSKMDSDVTSRIESLARTAKPKEEVSEVIFYGDSRVVGMSSACPGDAYVGEVAMGYDWMAGAGLSGLTSAMSALPDADVVFCFGVNDPGNVDAYASWFNSFAESHPDRRIWFESVNPIADGAAAANGYFTRNYMVTDFNARLSAAVGDRYLDVYSTLISLGFGTWDGVHYDAGTYATISEATKDEIEEKL